MAQAQRGKRCYLYTRVSTEMQIEGYSLDAQKEVLLNEAKLQRMTVVEVFSDEGKSGKNTTGRPAFREMMHRIETHADDVDYVLVYKLSRFGRNTADVLSNVQLMEDFGVHLYSVEDRIDSADEKGKLMISILASVSEMERENIRVQTMSGRIEKAREGKWNGGQPPYGYTLQNGILVVDEDEAKIIRLIFDKFINGDMSMNQIAKFLNENGYKKKLRQNNTYERFATTFVKNVLDNPVYCGYIAYGRRGSEKVNGKRNEYHIVKKSEYGLYEGQHEALIDREMWEATRYKREQTGIKWEKKHSMEHAHVLSGLLRCPVCGAKMYGVVCRRKRRSGGYYKDMWYYRCKRRIKIEGQSCDYKTHIRQDELNAQVMAVVRQAMSNMEFKETIDKAVGILDDTQELRDELVRLESSKSKDQARKRKVLQKIASLDPDDDAYDSMYDDLQDVIRGYTKSIMEAESQIRKIELALENSQDKEKIETWLRSMIKRVIDGTEDMSQERERDLMHALIESVEVYPEQKKNGLWVKKVVFKFPINIGGQELYTAEIDEPIDEEESFLPNQSHDETVVLLSQRRPTPQST